MDRTDILQGQFAKRGRLVLALIALLVGIQAVRGVLSPDEDARFVLSAAFVPASFTQVFAPTKAAAAISSYIRQDILSADDVVLLLGPNGLRWWTPITYAFLHGGWMHVLVNSVWLAAFGTALARRFGALRFLAFSAVCAIGGAAAHFLAHPIAFAPLVGASAAISGATAAAARFAFAPGAPLGPGAQRGSQEAYLGPMLPLRRLFSETRVTAFLITWFGANLVFGALATPIGVADAAIAWEAHIGGFLAGLVLFPVFDPVKACAHPLRELPEPPPAP